MFEDCDGEKVMKPGYQTIVIKKKTAKDSEEWEFYWFIAEARFSFGSYTKSHTDEHGAYVRDARWSYLSDARCKGYVKKPVVPQSVLRDVVEQIVNRYAELGNKLTYSAKVM
mgnify:CR=1 FL=1